MHWKHNRQHRITVKISETCRLSWPPVTTPCLACFTNDIVISLYSTLVCLPKIAYLLCLITEKKENRLLETNYLLTQTVKNRKRGDRQTNLNYSCISKDVFSTRTDCNDESIYVKQGKMYFIGNVSCYCFTFCLSNSNFLSVCMMAYLFICLASTDTDWYRLRLIGQKTMTGNKLVICGHWPLWRQSTVKGFTHSFVPITCNCVLS